MRQQLPGNKFGPICHAHKFCSVPYYFKDEKKTRKEVEKERESESIVSKHRQALPNCHVRGMSAGLSNLSEEALDDWIFQNSNRPLMGYLDPKKKFGIVNSYLEEIKQRYYWLRNSLKLTQGSTEYYFQDEQQTKKQKYIMQDGKSIMDPNNLLIDHLLLSPKEVWPGQNVMIREESKLKRKKKIESRRNAIYFENDINYLKFFSELKEEQKFDTSIVKIVKVEYQVTEEDQPPVQMVQRELKYFAHLMPQMFQVPLEIEVQEIQETAESRPLTSSSITQRQIMISKQHNKFKEEMVELVLDFKEFLKEHNKDVRDVVKNEMKQFENKLNGGSPKRKSEQFEFQSQSRPVTSQQKKTIRRRSQSVRNQIPQNLTTKSKGLAQQMMDWYDMAKEEKSTLPLALKEEVQQAHKYMNSMKQQKASFLVQIKVPSPQQIRQGNLRRHVVVKESETLSISPMKISIILD